MGRKVNIEIRVTTSGAVLSWEVFLENTNSSSKLKNWIYNSTSKYFYKTLDDFEIDDELIDVYAGCEGKLGGFMTCTVLLDQKIQEKKVICKNTDKNYAHESF
ncbi:MAG: hypothetical protein A2W99_05380 [Bacteroidetes bacterium GWF2_33_16]|nr:MAG: hypothetical protein A2X00_17900 [Bacteroidetes bacterium GWE2_32_14]OFY06093.1 MAG: hypothetical protein A2W99_05380 [Bacteroidetes bacterium GWF2_33_16]